MEILSQTDELTGLMNRRAFVSKANSLIKQAHRHQMVCSFFMLDIDHFKQINDTYGHDVGDEVLQKIGDILAKNCREHDLVARIGGEEFAICTMNSTHDSPDKFAEKLLSVIRAEKIHGVEVTVSIGIVSSHTATYEDLYKSADQMLYEAKNRGRNQFVSALI